MEITKVTVAVNILKEYEQLGHRLSALHTMADLITDGVISIYQFENIELPKYVSTFNGVLPIDRRIKPFDITLTSDEYMEVINCLIKIYSKKCSALKNEIEAL